MELGGTGSAELGTWAMPGGEVYVVVSVKCRRGRSQCEVSEWPSVSERWSIVTRRGVQKVSLQPVI
jgi:hypothetical protein